jgi:hypothetical protein
MKQDGIDPRYPAMFQPGGDGPGHATGGVLPESGAVEPGAPAAIAESPLPAEPFLLAEPDRPLDPVQVAAPMGAFAAPGPWPPWRWAAAVVLAIVLLATGLFCLTAQYWLPAARESDPAQFHGLEMQPWGAMIVYQASWFVGGGVAILGGLAFLASRRGAGREPLWRAAVGVFAVAAIAAGTVAGFANDLFPDVVLRAYDPAVMQQGAIRPDMPWTQAVQPVSVWLQLLGLLLAACLFAVPRLWQRENDGGHQAFPLGRPSAFRAACAGVVFLALGGITLFAPYLFPLSTGGSLLTSDTGAAVQLRSWPDMAQSLSQPLLLAGVVALAFAGLCYAVAPQGTQGGPDAVERQAE